jgi:hypothetical protein
MDRNSSHVSLFVSREFREALERSAAQSDRSLSSEVRTGLRHHTANPPGRADHHRPPGRERREQQAS